MSVGAVIFDLDHTLYNFMDCHEQADRAVGEYVADHFGIGSDRYHEQILAANAPDGGEDRCGQCRHPFPDTAVPDLFGGDRRAGDRSCVSDAAAVLEHVL